jgi:hypothetical protein
MVLLPPVSTAGVSTDDDVNELVKKVHALVARELGISDPAIRERRVKASV